MWFQGNVSLSNRPNRVIVDSKERLNCRELISFVIVMCQWANIRHKMLYECSVPKKIVGFNYYAIISK